MSLTFADLVEEIRKRSIDEQVRLKEIITHDLREAERERLYQSHLESMRELASGKLKSYSSVDELIQSLNEE